MRNIITPCHCYDKNFVHIDVSKETGMDRVKRMYQQDIYGVMSPEMHYLVQSASAAVIISAVTGAAIHMLKAKENYFRQNTASTFESQHFARRHLTDSMTKNGIKGALEYGFRYGSFSSLYLLSTMTAANYNNKITIWEHIGSGAMLGAMFRFNYGLKGMAGAASVGGFLGLIAGGALVISMKLRNITLDDLRDWEHYEYYHGWKKQGKS